MKPHVMLIGVVLAKKISQSLARVSIRRCEDELKRQMKTTRLLKATMFQEVQMNGLCQSLRSSDCLACQDKNKPL